MKKIILSGALMALFLCGFSANAGTCLSISSAPSSSVINSNEWDKLLDEYEQYVDQYVKTYKKAMSGDMSSMTEYVKLMEKAQQLSEKIDKAKGEMTSAQLQRYLKITQKMTDAIK